MSEISFKSFNYSPISIVPTLYTSPALHATHVLKACEEAKNQASWHSHALYAYSQRENIALFLKKKRKQKEGEAELQVLIAKRWGNVYTHPF